MVWNLIFRSSCFYLTPSILNALFAAQRQYPNQKTHGQTKWHCRYGKSPNRIVLRRDGEGDCFRIGKYLWRHRVDDGATDIILNEWMKVDSKLESQLTLGSRDRQVLLLSHWSSYRPIVVGCVGLSLPPSPLWEWSLPCKLKPIFSWTLNLWLTCSDRHSVTKYICIQDAIGRVLSV